MYLKQFFGEVPLDTWRWLYLNHENLNASPASRRFNHLNLLVRHGLLEYSRGHFNLTAAADRVLLKIREYEEELKVGVPLIDKGTVSDASGILCKQWWRGKTRERKKFLTNNEVIIFARSFKGVMAFDSGNLLDIEMIIYQLSRAIFAECYTEVFPRVLQRASYFSPGVVSFYGAIGDPISIDERYYDTIVTWAESKKEAEFIKVWVDNKEFLVIRNEFMSSRYLEDEVAIISPCVLEFVNDK